MANRLPASKLKRHKEAYERNKAGETLTSIAKDYGVSVARVRQLKYRWERELASGRLDRPTPHSPTDKNATVLG